MSSATIGDGGRASTWVSGRFPHARHGWLQVPGGAADLDGQLRVGDTIVSVDGVPLNGQLLQVCFAKPLSSAAYGGHVFDHTSLE